MVNRLAKVKNSEFPVEVLDLAVHASINAVSVTGSGGIALFFRPHVVHEFNLGLLDLESAEHFLLLGLLGLHLGGKHVITVHVKVTGLLQHVSYLVN